MIDLDTMTDEQLVEFARIVGFKGMYCDGVFAWSIGDDEKAVYNRKDFLEVLRDIASAAGCDVAPL
jgi:hypothetical protein